MQRLSGAIFQHDNARPHRRKESQDCFCTVTTLPSSARSPDLSPIEHIWDHLEGTCMPQCSIVSHRAFAVELPMPNINEPERNKDNIFKHKNISLSMEIPRDAILAWIDHSVTTTLAIPRYTTFCL
ncbi:hypothetical protein TNCV_3042701 [Trichonephila clavipes]|nr:hypothetical protein TNCV_3042701 [Trichonephila clavipes]